MLAPACQTQITAPSRSASTAIRPASPTSKGPMITLPPASRARSTDSSALATANYVFHVGPVGASAMGEVIPATSPPSICPTK